MMSTVLNRQQRSGTTVTVRNMVSSPSTSKVVRLTGTAGARMEETMVKSVDIVKPASSISINGFTVVSVTVNSENTTAMETSRGDSGMSMVKK